MILYEAAAKALKEQGMKKLPDLYALKAEYKRLTEEKERLYEQYGEAKKQMQEYPSRPDSRGIRVTPIRATPPPATSCFTPWLLAPGLSWP